MSSAPTLRSPESQGAVAASIDDGKDAVQTTLEDGPARALAYAARIRTFLTASSRYVAYTSDIGEAIRPLVTPGVVRAAYAVSWLYLGGDVSYAGYRTWKTGAGSSTHHGQHAESTAAAVVSALPEKDELRRRLQSVHSASEAKQEAKAVTAQVGHALAPSSGVTPAPPSEIAFVMARRAVFQTLASMALPAFTIHSIVRYSAPLFARSASRRLASLGPTISGLACVPALPYIFDHPVERAVDFVFDQIETVVLPSAKDAAEGAAKEGKAAAAAVVEETKKRV
ncbi:hypothetical protein OC835_006150 [Tilletia horrida]|uniref:Mitochondrial fission process protein 1 n=1 Tax=Tilletia horrida TaxID=155126 RepID=A0AAN6G9Y1_9BASI|nr:hypothetical protein OC835_006150 [Tilletia horrida]KAK0526984.1 hypothetical protein OC842_005020 [Tilletia horrida]KAK0556407.1 hypothetical protein OC844_005861 [Tilletia horrida]